MFGKLLLAFIIIPFVDLYLLLVIGARIGAFVTIALVIGTGILGAFLAKREGIAIVTELRRKMAYGQIPSLELLEGIMLLVGSVTLLTPGFLTDIFGFTMLIPSTRKALAHSLKHRIEGRIVKPTQPEVIVTVHNPESEDDPFPH